MTPELGGYPQTYHGLYAFGDHGYFGRGSPRPAPRRSVAGRGLEMRDTCRTQQAAGGHQRQVKILPFRGKDRQRA